MERPMTAADRAPQRRDVLRWRRYVRRVSWVEGDRFGYEDTYDWTHREQGDGYNSVKNEFTTRLGDDHIYVSRADGGPVTVEG